MKLIQKHLVRICLLETKYLHGFLKLIFLLSVELTIKYLLSVRLTLKYY